MMALNSMIFAKIRITYVGINIRIHNINSISNHLSLIFIYKMLRKYIKKKMSSKDSITLNMIEVFVENILRRFKIELFAILLFIL